MGRCCPVGDGDERPVEYFLLFFLLLLVAIFACGAFALWKGSHNNTPQPNVPAQRSFFHDGGRDGPVLPKRS